MSAGTRLAAFGVAAALVFGGGVALGNVVGPEPTRPEQPATVSTTAVSPTTSMDTGSHSGAHDTSHEDGSGR